MSLGINSFFISRKIRLLEFHLFHLLTNYES